MTVKKHFPPISVHATSKYSIRSTHSYVNQISAASHGAVPDGCFGKKNKERESQYIYMLGNESGNHVEMIMFYM